MKNAHSTPVRQKSAARHRTQRGLTVTSPARDEAGDDAADESGNRALHSVASGPNPNLGRDDIERVPPRGPGEGSVEST